MTLKQKRKLAQEIYDCELIHQSETATEEQKKTADNRVMQITRQLMALKSGGLPLVLEIDGLVQDIRDKKNEI